MDITDIQFFYGACPYGGKGFSEVRRCLKPEGIFVFTAPICWEQKTYEDSSKKPEEERIKYYGQKDNVRLYENDIVERIEEFGFKVTLYQSNQEGDEVYLKRMGYLQKDSILLCRRA